MAKVNKTPRISLNKLAEYLEANSTRRKQIIQDAKYPEDFKALRYKDAKEIISQYLTIHRDVNIVKQQISSLKNKTTKTDWQEQDKGLSVEMLESLINIDIALLNGCQLDVFNEENNLMIVKGVAISVYPDIVVSKTIKNVVNKGAIKIHVTKGFALSVEGQNIVTIILKEYVDNHLLKSGEVSNGKLCISLDTYNGVIQCCPSASAMRLKKVEAACEEIALRWPTL